MRNALMVLLLVAACDNPSKLDQAIAGAGPGSGDAIDRTLAGMRQYTLAMVPVFLGWDGDCEAQVARLLAVEPLVTKLRADMEATDQTKLYSRMAPLKDQIQKDIDGELATSHKTMADLQKNESEIKTKCGADPKFLDAMERVGVFKKRGPAAQAPGFVPPANPHPAPPIPAPAHP